MMDTSFENLVFNSWIGNNIFDRIKNFTKEAILWNREVFGNIFCKKRWVLARLEGIQNAQDPHFSHNLKTLENDIITYFNNILSQEERLWYKKSRAKWITDGKHNTKYFHLSTIIHRRSKITMLKNDDNIWVDDPDLLKGMVNTCFGNSLRTTQLPRTTM